MNEEQIQARIDAAVAAAMLARPAAPPVEPLVCARNPAQANTGLIDFRKNEGMKIYNSATAALSNKYAGKHMGLHIFLKDVSARARRFCWNEIISIPTDDGIYILIEQYGIVKIADIRAHAQVYEEAGNRNAQNTTMMHKFLYDSLSDETKLSPVLMITQSRLQTAKSITTDHSSFRNKP